MFGSTVELEMDEASERIKSKGPGAEKIRKGARVSALNRRLGVDTSAYRAPKGPTFGSGKRAVDGPERPAFMTQK